MSIIRKLLIAGAMAMVATAVAPRSAMAADVPAAADVVQPNAQSVTLDAAEMNAVQGDGFWKKLWKGIKKVVKVIIGIIVNDPCFGRTDCPTITGEEVMFDASLAQDITDTFENEITITEYYDDYDALNEGRMSSSSYSETGYVFVNREVSGGGGSTCIDMSGPGCENMF